MTLSIANIQFTTIPQRFLFKSEKPDNKTEINTQYIGYVWGIVWGIIIIHKVKDLVYQSK